MPAPLSASAGVARKHANSVVTATGGITSKAARLRARIARIAPAKNNAERPPRVDLKRFRKTLAGTFEFMVSLFHINRGSLPVADKLLPIVTLSGAIDVRSIEDAFAKIKQASGPDGLEIDLSAVTDIDLTFVQLLEAARRTATETGAPLRLSAPASGFVLETLQRGGFLSDPPDARSLFWAGAAL